MFLSIEELYLNLSGENIRITVSAGVSILKYDQNMEAFIERADAAMYLAKSRGKNMVCREDELDPE